MTRHEFVSKKNVFAALFALAGIGLALWSAGVLPRPKSQAYSRPSPAQTPRPVVAPLLPSDYATLISPDTIDAAMSELKMNVQSQARSNDGLRSLGEEAIQSLAEAALLSIKPVLLGSFEDYVQSVTTLGGDPDVSRSLWDAGRDQFAMRPVSIEGVRVRRSVQPGESINISDGDRLSKTNKYDIRVGNVHSTATPSRYPAVASYRKKNMNVYEVRLPIKALAFKEPSIEIDAEIGIDFAWDASASRWQPVQYLLYQPILTAPLGDDGPLSPYVAGMSY